MAAPKYQIFVSSTFEDLENERDQVIKAILEMGHIPVGMEMFSAADEEQWAIIARNIDESDYYIVLLAHRYGSITDGVSYTRKEYEYAVSMGVPVLGFIIEKNATWPPKFVDKTEPACSQLKEFKAIVRAKPVSEWSSAADLYGRCAVALGKAFAAQPRQGWVRAGAAVGPEVLAEISRLSTENALLREQVRRQTAEEADDHDQMLLKLTLDMDKITKNLGYRTQPSEEWLAGTIALGEVFFFLGPDLVSESSLSKCSRRLAMHLSTTGEWDIAAKNQVQALLVDLMALGLTTPSKRKHAVADSEQYWTLTELGVDVLRHMRRFSLVKYLDDHEPTPLAKKAPAKKAPAK